MENQVQYKKIMNPRAPKTEKIEEKIKGKENYIQKKNNNMVKHNSWK